MVLPRGHAAGVEVDGLVERDDETVGQWRGLELGAGRTDPPKLAVEFRDADPHPLERGRAGIVAELLEVKPGVFEQQLPDLVTLSGRQEIRPQPSGADRIGFVDDDLPPGVVPGDRHREGESEQQAEQSEDRTLDRAAVAFGNVRIAAARCPAETAA